jgi:hypothetical protein
MNWIYAPQRTNVLMHRCSELIGATWDGIDWRRREIRDSAVIFGIFAAVWACTHWFDLAPRFFQFGTNHADWEVVSVRVGLSWKSPRPRLSTILPLLKT